MAGIAVTDELLRHLSKAFDDEVRNRGERFFRSNKVELISGDDRTAHAVAYGSDTYDVAITYDDHQQALDVACNCPFGYEHAEPCKHIWATLLAARVEGMLTTAASVRQMRLLEVDELLTNDQSDTDPSLPSVLPPNLERFLAGTSAASASRQARAPEPSTWRRQFAAVAQAMSLLNSHSQFRWPTDRQIVYVVNVAETLSGGLLSVDLKYRQRLMNGNWSKLKSQRIPREALTSLPDPMDQQILSLLHGGEDRSDPYNYGYYRGEGSMRFGLPPALQLPAMQIICRTGRALLCQRGRTMRDEILSDLTWDEGPAWRFRVQVQRRTKRASGRQREFYEIGGVLDRDGQSMDLAQPALLTAGGLLFTAHAVAALQHGDAFPWIAALREQKTIQVPVKDADALLETMFTHPCRPPCDLPEQLTVQIDRSTPVPCLKISQQDRWRGADRLKGEWSFDYDGRTVPWHSQTGGVYHREARRLIERNREAETAAERQLRQAGFKDPPQTLRHEGFLELMPKQLSHVVAQLTASGWRVEAEGKLYRTAGNFHMNLVSGVDWFELHGSAQFDDQVVALPDLLKAIKRGESTVRLGDGTVGILPEEWLRKYGLIATVGTAEDEFLRFGRTQVGLLDALLLSMPEVNCDALFEQVRQQVRSFAGVKPIDPPSHFLGELRPYQREGLGWLAFLQQFGFGGCLADDMGLGKTVQVLGLLASRAEHRQTGSNGSRPPPSLAVVPRSLIHNWKEEARRFTPSIRVLEHCGTDRSKYANPFEDCDLVLTTYGTLRRDITLLKDVPFDYVILDEAQAIKNDGSASAKAARLLQAQHRLALSGTPVENHLGELWSLLEFLNPGMLGSASLFKQFVGAKSFVDESSQALLGQALRPFILRRTKAQVAKDLPDKLEQTLYCDLPRKQRDCYDELRDYYRRSLLKKVAHDGLNKSKIHVLEALLRLRQAACHPGLIDKAKRNEPSAKLDALLPQLIEVVDEGHKALVFSQFTSMLDIVRMHLNAAKIRYEYLDGQTRDRAKRIERFQSNADCSVFLISLKAGGLGLNLTAADYVFLLDPWWNPAVEAQAIDRAHRIGQTRQVFAYRLIARDTVEEKVLELQKNKRDLADAIINADHSLIRNLSREDLELLLS